MSVKNKRSLSSCNRRVTSHLRRVEQRPDPAAWGSDELLTLPEAAALFWPHGPLTVATLRTAHCDGQLAVAEIAGKFFTTKTALEKMSVCRVRDQANSVSTSPADEGRTSPNDKALNRIAELVAKSTRSSV